METDAVIDAFTVIETALLVAVVGDAHVAFDVSIQVTISPFVQVEALYAEAFVPTLFPFNFH